MKIKSWDEADVALKEIAAAQRLNALAKGAIEVREGQIEKAEEALEEWVREHAQDLKEKSLDLPHGRVWLHWATKLYSRSWKKVLATLVERKAMDLLHTKPKVNKQALEKESDEFLADLNVRRKSGDVFGYEAR